MYKAWQWRNFFISYISCFLPFCGTSSAKCLLLWHHFHSKIVIIRTYMYSWTNWFSFIPITRQYDVLPHKMAIVLWPQSNDVTSPYVCVGWSDVTVICDRNKISMLWGNTAYCVKLSGEDLPRYSNQIESIGLRKCPHYHCLTNTVMSL